MKTIARYLLQLLIIALPGLGNANINVGIGKTNITPPIGTSSAGYVERKGEGMHGVHDSLLAIALFIDNGEKQLALCSVDHLGFIYKIVQEVTQKIHAHSELKRWKVFIASPHTHSGGGSYLNIPGLGASLAGIYSLQTTQFYMDQTAEAIFQAYHHQVPVRLGIGYRKAKDLSRYRGLWPKNHLMI